MMNTRILWAGVVLVSACAGPVYEGKYGYERGWRIAKVSHVGGADADFPPTARDCRVELAAGALRGARFARVTFYGDRRVQSMIARAAPGYSPEPDDSVYVNEHDCMRDLEITRKSP